MNYNEVRLPTDLQINMMLIYQEHLSKQYDVIRGLIQSHENEISILWVLTLGLLGASLINSYTKWKDDNARS